MAGQVVFDLQTSEPIHLDGELCSVCWKSGLWRVEVYSLTADGVSPFGTWTGCGDCGSQSIIDRTKP